MFILSLQEDPESLVYFEKVNETNDFQSRSHAINFVENSDFYNLHALWSKASGFVC